MTSPTTPTPTWNSAWREAVRLRHLTLWTVLTLLISLWLHESLPVALARLAFVLLFCVLFRAVGNRYLPGLFS